MDEQRILARSNQQKKMDFIKTTNKQKKEIQHGLYHKILKQLGIWAMVLKVIRVHK